MAHVVSRPSGMLIVHSTRDARNGMIWRVKNGSIAIERTKREKLIKKQTNQRDNHVVHFYLLLFLPMQINISIGMFCVIYY